MEYAIEIENLKKDFVEGKIVTHALRGLNLKVRKGEIFGLLGPNGSGKTTTIHIVSTLISPTSGTARLIGHDVMKEPQRIRELCGVCAGGATFLWDMTPKEILKYYSMLFGLKAEERKIRVERLVKELGITEFQDAQFYILSTGMKQKVALAKSLLNEPEVLLLDEPTAGLDVEVAIYIRKYVSDIVKDRGVTVILTSHHLYEVEELCREIAIINEGRLVTKGSVSEIRKQMRFPDIAYFCLDRLTGLEFLRKIRGVHGYEIKAGGIFVKVDKNSDVITSIMSELKKRRFRITDMELKKPSLEDVFLKIVKKDREWQTG